MPSASVVLPTCNRAALVTEAVRSVLAQSFDDLELIVVVDGSTDDTVSRLGEFRDSRLRVIVQENGGLSAARNKALAHASGEFVALLDDDVRLPLCPPLTGPTLAACPVSIDAATPSPY